MNKDGKFVKLLEEKDSITAPKNNPYTLYFSDGSVSVLTPESTLTVNKAEHSTGNTLATKIELTLNAGTIWTKASKMFGKNADNPDSSFEIEYMVDTTAAVRGTIFCVSRAT